MQPRTIITSVLWAFVLWGALALVAKGQDHASDNTPSPPPAATDAAPTATDAAPAATDAAPTAVDAAPAAVDAAPAAAESEIRAAAADFAAAVARGDAAGVAEHWTMDGDYIDEYGQRYAGRPAIQAEYEQFFQQHPGAVMHITVDAVRLLGPDTAIEDGRVVLESPAAGSQAASRYTAVHIRQDGKWLLASVRDMRIETAPQPGDLADLAWLIGTWTASGEGVQLDVTYRWIVENKVLERSHRVTQSGHLMSAGTQIIGWDPTSQAIESWSFSTAGGYAVGSWSAHDTGWSVASVGMTVEGTPITATHSLVRFSATTLSCTTTGQWLGDTFLPDVAEVLLTRK